MRNGALPFSRRAGGSSFSVGREAGYAAPVRTSSRRLPVLLLLAPLSGCAHAEGDAPADRLIGEPSRPPPQTPYDPRCAGSSEPGPDPVSDLVRLTTACAASAGLEAVT